MTARRFLTLALLAALTAASPLQAQDQTQDAAAAQAAMAAAATPGPVHAFLADKAGAWTVTTTMWPAPGAEPMVSTMTSKSEMVLGGRYLKEEFAGEVFGLPFTGIGYTGYDNTTGTITATWIDNMSTATMVMTGKYAQAGDPLEVAGSWTIHLTGGEVFMRSVSTWQGHDRGHVDYYAITGGLGEVKTMAMDYQRVK